MLGSSLTVSCSSIVLYRDVIVAISTPLISSGRLTCQGGDCSFELKSPRKAIPKKVSKTRIWKWLIRMLANKSHLDKDQDATSMEIYLKKRWLLGKGLRECETRLSPPYLIWASALKIYCDNFSSLLGEKSSTVSQKATWSSGKAQGHSKSSSREFAIFENKITAIFKMWLSQTHAEWRKLFFVSNDFEISTWDHKIVAIKYFL